MKCKHKNFTIHEYMSATFAYVFENGTPPEDGLGWYTGTSTTGEIGVSCSDCGFSKRYRFITKSPKWVQDAWERLSEQRDEAAR
jgi:hypothetical protein